jgi:hypothetical protein
MVVVSSMEANFMILPPKLITAFMSKEMDNILIVVINMMMKMNRMC